MKTHFVSVIIPTRSLNDYIIKENLPAFLLQTYKNFEVLILPNESDNLDSELEKHYQWLRIIPTGKVTRPAEKRDIGVKHAKGNVIAFIDDDAFASANWLERAVETFDRDTDLSAVCGPGVLPQNALFWERVFDAVLKTWIGSGGYSYRFNPEKKRFVDDYPSMNFLVKKSMFEKVGGFNNEYWPGEDSKLCEDIVYKENGKILYDPDVLIFHHRRNNLVAYLRQHGNYGFHRGAFLAHGDKNSRRFGYLIPSMFVLYLAIILFIFAIIPTQTEKYSYLFLIPLCIYIFFELYVFLKTLLANRNLALAAGASLVLFLTHAVYGILFIKGFWTGLFRHEKIYS